MVRRIPVPPGSEMWKERGVDEVTYVEAALAFGMPTTRIVIGPGTTMIVHVYALFVSFASATEFSRSATTVTVNVPGVEGDVHEATKGPAASSARIGGSDTREKEADGVDAL